MMTIIGKVLWEKYRGPISMFWVLLFLFGHGNPHANAFKYNSELLTLFADTGVV